MHRISLILWKNALPRGRDIGLRDVLEVWNPSKNRSPIGLENCIFEESKAKGHLSEGVKCPTKMDDMSTASEKKRNPY